MCVLCIRDPRSLHEAYLQYVFFQPVSSNLPLKRVFRFAQAVTIPKQSYSSIHPFLVQFFGIFPGIANNL